MTVMVHEPQTREDLLLEAFHALETPEGFRAELIDGEIVVTPPPGGDHDENLWSLVEQVVEKSSTRFVFWGNKGLKTPSGGRCPNNHVIPDGTFAPKEFELFRDGEPWSPADRVAMVVEVTSSPPDRDRVAKRHCYARAGIPLYLLMDREKQMVTLFSEPKDDDYLGILRVPFGKAVALPEPFDFEFDTSELF
jgi:Uma2 family endonuclease